MQFSPELYQKITDYLAKYYDVPLYTHHDMQHPVLFYPATEAQQDKVDSVLGQPPTATLTQDDFYVYDYGFLHSLQNKQVHLFNGTTFAMKRIRARPVRIDAVFGKYFDMLATCYAMETEVIDALQTKLVRLPMRSQFHREISARNSLSDGRGRSAAIGGAGLVIFNDGDHYHAILSHRTNNHATRPDSYHLLPAFIFQPMTDTMRAGEWSIEHHFYREWLEELFGMAEADTMDFYQHPALVDLKQMQDNQQAGLYLSGVAFNLLTLRPEICLVLVIHDAGWWQRVNAADSAYKLITPEARNQIIRAPITTDESLINALPQQDITGFVPQAIPALWEGVKIAREKIRLRDKL